MINKIIDRYNIILIILELKTLKENGIPINFHYLFINFYKSFKS